jgi:hypothetical protein
MEDFSIIGLLGPAGSGKDLVADWFQSKDFVKVAFADPMKRFVAKTFGISEDRLWGVSELRNEVFDIDDPWWYEAIGKLAGSTGEIVHNVLPVGLRVDGYLKLHEWFTNLHKTYTNQISTRVILQTLGSEWGRTVDPLMWARYAHKIAYELSLGGTRYWQTKGLIDAPGYPRKYAGVIIPDHRFKNEVIATKECGGYVIRLRRLSMENKPAVGITGHGSEAEHKEMTDSMFDHVFNFEEGIDKVHQTLEKAYEQKLWVDPRASCP